MLLLGCCVVHVWWYAFSVLSASRWWRHIPTSICPWKSFAWRHLWIFIMSFNIWWIFDLVWRQRCLNNLIAFLNPLHDGIVWEASWLTLIHVHIWVILLNRWWIKPSLCWIATWYVFILQLQRPFIMVVIHALLWMLQRFDWCLLAVYTLYGLDCCGSLWMFWCFVRNSDLILNLLLYLFVDLLYRIFLIFPFYYHTSLHLKMSATSWNCHFDSQTVVVQQKIRIKLVL